MKRYKDIIKGALIVQGLAGMSSVAPRLTCTG